MTKEHFLNRVEAITESGCWIWLGCIDSSGYGYFQIKGRTTLAHRESHRLFKGEIPENLCVCHTCDVPLCVNPNHLFLGTVAENIADRVRKGRSARGARHGRTKLSDGDVAEIRASNMTGRQLASKYKVSASVISDIVRGNTWAHIKENNCGT